MPIRITPTLEALSQLLEADATLDEQLTSGVYAHRLPEPPTGAHWSRAVLRQVALPQGIRQHPQGITTVPVQLMIECAGYPDPDLLLEAAHERAELVLTGQTPTTDYGDVLLPIERYSRPTAPQWDQESQCYWSTATYLVTIVDE